MRGADAWVPLVMQSTIRYGGNASSHDDGDTRKPWPPQENIEWLNLFARVPTATEQTSIAAALTVRHHADVSARRGADADYAAQLRAERIVLAPAGRGLSSLRSQASTALYVLLAMMVILLLIASGNVASLLVARATSREREIAVRLSLGAGRVRLVRQLLVESLLLGLGGGVVGLGFAVWGRDLLLGLFASGQASLITLDTGLDWRVLVFSAAMSLMTGLACGLLPALRGTRVPVSESLKLQARAVGLVSRRTLLAGRALVAAQMAFCLLLLIVAGLFVRSLRVLTASEIGFDRQHLLGARLDVRSLGLLRRAAAGALHAPARPRAGTAGRAVGQPVDERPRHGILADQRLQHRGLHASDGRADVDERGDCHRGLLLDRRLEDRTWPAVRPGRSRRKLQGHADQRNDGAPVLSGPGPDWQALGLRCQLGQHARRLRRRRRRGGREVSGLESRHPNDDLPPVGAGRGRRAERSRGAHVGRARIARARHSGRYSPRPSQTCRCSTSCRSSSASHGRFRRTPSSRN